VWSLAARPSGALRQLLWERGEWTSAVIEGKEEEGAKFSDYFAASEPLKRLPSHRVLALFRGRHEGILRLAVVLPQPDTVAVSEPEQRIAARAGVLDKQRPADAWLATTVRWAWKIRLLPQLESEIENRLRDEAEAEAIRVFGRNLHDLLLAAPAGQRTTMGLDPGIRTGVKVAVVDGTGKLLETAVVYPHEPQSARPSVRRGGSAEGQPLGVRAFSPGCWYQGCVSAWCSGRTAPPSRP
jgi:uncharacterized protein